MLLLYWRIIKLTTYRYKVSCPWTKSSLEIVFLSEVIRSLVNPVSNLWKVWISKSTVEKLQMFERIVITVVRPIVLKVRISWNVRFFQEFQYLIFRGTCIWFVIYCSREIETTISLFSLSIIITLRWNNSIESTFIHI